MASQSQRLVLWGCTISDEAIKAELFFADLRLPKSIEVGDRAGQVAYQVEVPQPLQGSLYAKKGQHITLKRLG